MTQSHIFDVSDYTRFLPDRGYCHVLFSSESEARAYAARGNDAARRESAAARVFPPYQYNGGRFWDSKVLEDSYIDDRRIQP